MVRPPQVAICALFVLIVAASGCADSVDPAEQSLDFGELLLPGEVLRAAAVTSRGKARTLEAVTMQTGAVFRVNTELPLELEADTKYPIDFLFVPAADAFGDHQDLATLSVKDSSGTETLLRVALGARFTQGDSDGDGQIAATLGGDDCDDQDATVYLLAPEVCDGQDNDCDGEAGPEEVDADQDGFLRCADDCDDGDDRIYPDAPELCDDLDDDCDGQPGPDESDADGDGWSACDGDCEPTLDSIHPGALETCDGYDTDCSAGGTPPVQEADVDLDGYLLCEDDCDDGDAAARPGGTEVCDGSDNDCDGTMLEGEDDADDDGQPLCAGDCDDSRDERFVGNPEVCDGLDNDCDLVVPVNENDGDGDAVPGCEDCDDTEALVFPMAPEICDLLDNDCDGQSDEGLDADGDGASPCAGDCDDADASIFPGATETCDGLDEDCDEDYVLGEEYDGDGDGVLDCLDTDCPRFVDGSFSGTEDGSAAGPWTSVGEAMAAAGSCLSIHVAPGTYTEAVDFGTTAFILVGTGGPLVTVIDGAGAGPVIDLDGGVTGAVLRGFTVRGGARPTGNGGGIAVVNGAVTLQELIVISNSAGLSGGGIHGDGADITLLDSTIASNTAGIDGAGMWIGGSAGEIDGNVIFDNVATDDGGGVVLAAGSTSDFFHNIVRDNTATDWAGGLLVYESSGVEVRYTIVDGNVAGRGGGAYVFNSSPVFIQNTFWDNHATTAGQAGGLRIWNGVYRNNIIASGTGYGVELANMPVAAFQYSDLWGWSEGSYMPEDTDGDGSLDTILTGVDGNIEADPLFVSASADGDGSNDDLHLQAGSPCVDAGNPATSFQDADGSRADMGGYGGPLGAW